MSGKVVILCAPSGSGKTTLAKHLLSIKKLNLKFSVSSTTRKKRVNEEDGIDYHFISIESFKNKIDNDSFIEYEKVYDNIFYGTLKSEVEKLIKNHNIIFDVDVIGAISLKKYFSKKSISIFINPGSIEVLENRLIKRGKDSKTSLKERLSKARNEMDMIDNFDTSIINDDLDYAKRDIFKTVDIYLFFILIF